MLSFIGRCLVMSSPVLVRYLITKLDPKEAPTASSVPSITGASTQCCGSCKCVKA